MCCCVCDQEPICKSLLALTFLSLCNKISSPTLPSSTSSSSLSLSLSLSLGGFGVSLWLYTDGVVVICCGFRGHCLLQMCPQQHQPADIKDPCRRAFHPHLSLIFTSTFVASYDTSFFLRFQTRNLAWVVTVNKTVLLSSADSSRGNFNPLYFLLEKADQCNFNPLYFFFIGKSRRVYVSWQLPVFIHSCSPFLSFVFTPSYSRK